MRSMPRSSSCSIRRCAASRSPSAAASCLPPPMKPGPSACAAACRGGRARELCPQLIFVGGHFSDYQRLGDAAIKVLDDFTPLVERISIDEAFADVAGCTHLFGPPAEIAASDPPPRAGGARPADLDRRGAHQASGQDRLAGRQARRAGGRRSRHRAGLPARSAGRADVGRRPGDQGAAGRDRRRDHRPAGEDAGRSLERLLGPAAGEKLAALAWNRDPREIKTHRRAHSAGAQSALGRKPAESAFFVPTLLHLADRVASRLRAKSRPGRTVTVRVRFADLRSVTRSVTLDEPISATAMLAEIAEDLVRGVLADHPREKTISLLAISVSHLEECRAAARPAARACRREAPAGQRKGLARSAPTAPSTRSASASERRPSATARWRWESSAPCPTRSASWPRRTFDFTRGNS